MSGRKAAEASGGETGSKHAPFSGLVVVATPIGNLEDLGGRAARALRTADVVACEDTRTSGRLLAHLGATTDRVAYHEHNAERMRPVLMQRLKAGETVALVSDAGTPLISDPGFKLVRACVEAGIPVTTVPGPSAVLAALVLAGLPTDRFYFGGFLPPKTAARRRALDEVAALQATLLFFESAQRLPASLADMAASLGDRPAAVAREMTKLFEEVRRDGLEALAAHYAGAGSPKGEVVVVVAPPAAAETPSDEALDTRLQALLDGGASVRDAAATVASETGTPRRALYARALALGRDEN